MSMRQCAYKDCENFTINGAASGNFTLFQFPKNTERHKLWMKLGQVDERQRLHSSALCMCSEHFDAKKYMSINNRRTILVGAAVPYPYEPPKQQPAVEAEEEEEEEVMLLEVLHTTPSQLISDEDEEQWEQRRIDEEIHMLEMDDVGDCSVEVEAEAVEDALAKDYEILKAEDHLQPTKTEMNTTITINNDQLHKRKRKSTEQTNLISTSSVSAPPTKKLNFQSPKIKVQPQAAASCSSSAPLKAAPPAKKQTAAPKILTPPPPLQPKQNKKNEASPAAHTDLEIDADGLIDEQAVTTFIFKGEEYVQMPKAHYVQEKLALMQRLQCYERLITNVRGQVNALDLS